MTTQSSLYEQIGGAAAVRAAVDIFYGKVLADPHISGFFADVDMNRQRGKQAKFLAMAFGGPKEYSDKDMRDGHRHLVERGLDDSHFDAVAGHLKATLEELTVPGDLIGQVLAIAESTREDVLNR